MKTTIFLKMVKVKKGLNNFSFSNGTNKSTANFRETIPQGKNLRQVLRRGRSWRSAAIFIET
jgi:hypothetical protein